MQIKIGARQFGLCMHIERFLACAQNAQTSGQHQAFLRTGHRHVNAPVIKAEINRAQRRHGIDKQQCRVFCIIEDLPNGADIGRHARGGFVMAGQNGLDLMLGIFAQNLSVLLQRHTGAPLSIDDLYIESEFFAHRNPQMTELTKTRREYFVTRRECVGDCGFPATGAGRRKHKRRATLSAEHFFQTRKNGAGQRRKRWRTMVFHRYHHRAQHAIGHVGRTGYKQKVTTSHLYLLELINFGVSRAICVALSILVNIGGLKSTHQQIHRRTCAT